MGVPAMFRWLSQKYPKIVSGVIEEQAKEVNGEKMPVDRTKANPNGEEFDNLYLDMNGIVHPCSHPEDKPAPETEADMMKAIFEYTDRVVGMVRPRRLLYLAVDGVAPRAKMNQQRSRRFRAAREAKEKDAEKAEFQRLLKQQALAKGEDITTIDEVIKKTWDSNAITPGTPFMFLLAESLQYWCAYKFTTDPSWKDMKVIISDASVPGEGEHKIMNFVRSQRAMPSHDPNTRHVIYGLDADLIMLGLATHEPHFRVLREDVFYDGDKKCNRCGRKGHKAFDCRGQRPLTEEEKAEEAAAAPVKPFIWLHVNILREYLAVEMDSPRRRFKYDLERALDDWVFMCFFVGNDFLPHLPSLEIRDQGIDTLISIWRDLIGRIDDYVTKDGYPNMKRVQEIMLALGSREATIFKKRKEHNDRQDQKRKDREAQQANRNGSQGNNQPPFKRRKPEDTSTYLNAGVVFFSPGEAQSNAVRDATAPFAPMAKANQDQSQANRSAAAVLKEQLKARANGSLQSDTSTPSSSTDVNMDPATPDISVSLGKRKLDAVEDSDNGTPGRATPIVQESPKPKDQEMAEDTIKLWEPGYEERYYQQKFGVGPEEIDAKKRDVSRHYAKGLCWVLAYYMQGCPSWTWYYPEHYAPFAADFTEVGDLDPHTMFNEDKGKPFKPYEQLMAVLPPASNHSIPEPFRPLMVEVNSDPELDITEFYNEDFVIDLNGKKFAWQGVAILPFIDEKRLLRAMGTKYPELSDDEVRRNELGKETLMFSQEHPFFNHIAASFFSKKPVKELKIDPEATHKLHGQVQPHDQHVADSQLVAPFETDEDDEFAVIQDQSMRVYYEMPVIDKSRSHKSALLPGLQLPTKALTDEDIRAVRNKGERGGGGRGGRGGHRNSYDNRNNDYNNNNNWNAPQNVAPGSLPGVVTDANGVMHFTGAGGAPVPPPPQFMGRPEWMNRGGPPAPPPSWNPNPNGYGGGRGGYAAAQPPPPNYGGGGRGGGGYGGYQGGNRGGGYDNRGSFDNRGGQYNGYDAAYDNRGGGGGTNDQDRGQGYRGGGRGGRGGGAYNGGRNDNYRRY
ncbi:XRN 5'-3' exonuclease N-terminus-domain-containing protein [Lophiotrema nucula]|uniref:5'-3' exoribonuclease n=1 Tax=Lophiotrema nucula TaxID=690887 RepID=A0A6A5YU24_9PLEO|nr:XRN 5'-3' exonuclease N-terminus-domain-containing protein [Lophiotrema nucula]